jgi:hypothetical protein
MQSTHGGTPTASEARPNADTVRAMRYRVEPVENGVSPNVGSSWYRSAKTSRVGPSKSVSQSHAQSSSRAAYGRYSRHMKKALSQRLSRSYSK